MIILEDWRNGEFYISASRRLKIIGDIFQIDRYGRSLTIGKKKPKKIKVDNNLKVEKKEDSKSAFYRAKVRIRDAINANAYQYRDLKGRIIKPMFLSLTFRKLITSLDIGHREFTNFIKRFNYLITGKNRCYLKYVSVVEFQKRGAIHYHVVLFNLPFIKNIYDKLAKIWTVGSRNIIPIDNIQNIGQYVCKYMTKTGVDDRLKARKSYFISRDLKKPTILYSSRHIRMIETQLEKLPADVKHEVLIESLEYIISVDRKIYNLFDDKALAQKLREEVTDYIKEQNDELHSIRQKIV